ncbi:MAG: heat-shock protein Hsp20 [Euryarchaeota archaeon TMED255]|nr:MAG: heat-shock protein Hsp20 [Euryarchaeota archaeon TMED255]
MNKLDFAPLYRSTIGFDYVASLFDTTATKRNQQSYPPYNIQRLDENSYKITMAVAGFSEDEIDITAENDILIISAQKSFSEEEENYLYRGIAERDFRRQFKLDNYIKVTNAALENGLLQITLEREIPDAMKPRKIPINHRDISNQALRSA